jgi:hypothetical protein
MRQVVSQGGRGMPLDMRLLSHLLILIVPVMARLRGVG